MAKTLRGLAQVIARDGEYAEAIPLLEESVAAFSDLDDPPLLALALTDLGVVVGHEGVALCLINLGNQARIDGNPDLARARLEEGAAIARSGNWPYIVGLMAGNLGDLALSRGDSGEACLHYREALAVFTSIGEADQVAHCVRGLARHAWIEGRAADAVSSESAETDAQWVILHERASSAIKEHLGPDRFMAAYRSGAATGRARSRPVALNPEVALSV
jgi:tetratricopeptide (TPR) repeat protein